MAGEVLARHRQNWLENTKQIGNMIGARKANTLAKEFVQNGKFSPEDIMEFGKEKGLSIEALKPIIEFASGYMRFQQEKQGDFKTVDTVDPTTGIKTQQGYRTGDPTKRFDIGTTGVPKPEATTFLGPGGETNTGRVDPYTQIVSPNLVDGQRARTTKTTAEGQQDEYNLLNKLLPLKEKLKMAGASSVTVNTGATNTIQDEANKVYGKGIGTSVETVFNEGKEARTQNVQLDSILLAMSDGARTGYGEETILNLRSLGQTLGVDTGDLSGEELIRTVSNQMALRLRNPDSGLGLTGNTSNRDLIFLKDSVPGLARTEAGNRVIIQAMQKKNEMRQAIAQEQSRLIEANNGSIPTNLQTELIKFANNYQVYTPEEKIKIQGVIQGVNIPKGAIEFLKANPQQKENFKSKYGFIPEGI